METSEQMDVSTTEQVSTWWTVALLVIVVLMVVAVVIAAFFSPVIRWGATIYLGLGLVVGTIDTVRSVKRERAVMELELGRDLRWDDYAIWWSLSTLLWPFTVRHL